MSVESSVKLAATKKKSIRTQIVIGLFVILLAMAGTAFWLVKSTTTQSGCGSLATGGSGQATAMAIVLELQGNTSSDAQRSAAFVQTQLTASTSQLGGSYDVQVAFVRYGESITPSGCLATPRRIQSPADDLQTYTDKNTSSDTRKSLGSELSTVRSKQIGWIAAEVSSQVRGVSFAGLDPSQPKLSPRLAWQAALKFDSPTAVLAVYSPMTSTVNDCLMPPSDSASDPLQAPADTSQEVNQEVIDCLTYDQIGRSKAAETSIVVDDALLDAAQRQRASAMQVAFCKNATSDGCSATPK
jgi:hypothetical protein